MKAKVAHVLPWKGTLRSHSQACKNKCLRWKLSTYNPYPSSSSSQKCTYKMYNIFLQCHIIAHNMSIWKICHTCALPFYTLASFTECVQKNLQKKTCLRNEFFPKIHAGFKCSSPHFDESQVKRNEYSIYSRFHLCKGHKNLWIMLYFKSAVLIVTMLGCKKGHNCVQLRYV